MAEMIILWIGTLVLVRYVAKRLLPSATTAASGIRSWPPCFAPVAHRTDLQPLLGRNAGVAWLAGGFMAIGYLTHLILDEIYSVDVMDTRLKASFGTALKLIDPRHPGATAAMAVGDRDRLPAGAAKQAPSSTASPRGGCGAACSIACCRRTGGSASTGGSWRGGRTCPPAPRPRPTPQRPPKPSQTGSIAPAAPAPAEAGK